MIATVIETVGAIAIGLNLDVSRRGLRRRKDLKFAIARQALPVVNSVP